MARQAAQQMLDQELVSTQDSWEQTHSSRGSKTKLILKLVDDVVVWDGDVTPLMSVPEINAYHANRAVVRAKACSCCSRPMGLVTPRALEVRRFWVDRIRRSVYPSTLACPDACKALELYAGRVAWGVDELLCSDCTTRARVYDDADFE